MLDTWISPSILSADFSKLGDEVDAVIAAGADSIHFDVMDNHFVPNLSFGACVCESLQKRGVSVPIDVHLMCSPVERLITQFASLDVEYISIHAEASNHTDRLLQSIKDQGPKAGLVLNPATPIDFVDYVLDKCDLVLLMTVNPGFGGQSFLHSQLAKIEALRKRIDALGKDIRLQVDGGVNDNTIALAKEAGADTFVVGSYLFRSNDYASTIKGLRDKL